MRRYAEGTTVEVRSSQAEITGILMKHGVIRQAWASEPEGDMLQFELAGHQYRIRIERPTTESLHAQWIADGKPPTTTKYLPSESQVNAEWRRRWRANVLLLKAKLEFAEGDDNAVVRELMPYALMTDGRTREEHIVSGDPKIALLPARTG
jgi:hypothetical protein